MTNNAAPVFSNQYGHIYFECWHQRSEVILKIIV